jgi:hypothetical protein
MLLSMFTLTTRDIQSPAVQQMKPQNREYIYTLLQGNSVCMIPYSLNDGGSIPGKGWDFSLCYCVQTISGVHLASYPVDTGISFQSSHGVRLN